jgi:hypothetical protein
MKELQIKREHERRAGEAPEAIVALTAKPTVTTRTGIDAVDAHPASDGCLRMCEKPGVPPHELKLSKGCVAMITRNMYGKFKTAGV